MRLKDTGLTAQDMEQLLQQITTQLTAEVPLLNLKRSLWTICQREIIQ